MPPRSSTAWIRSWLACLALYYPLLWLSNSVLQALPGLLRVSLFGDRLEWFRVRPYGLLAFSASRGIHPAAGRQFPLFFLAAFAVAVAVLMRLSRPRGRFLTGITVGVLSNVLMLPWLMDWAFHGHLTVRTFAGVGIFFALLCLGQRWMLAAWPTQGFGLRAGSLLGGFVLPWMVFVLLPERRFLPARGLLALPAALAALTVSAWPVPPSIRVPSPGWRMIARGGVATLILAACISPAGRVANRFFIRAERGRTEATLASIPPVPANAPYPRVLFQKGVNFTAEFPEKYDSEGTRDVLRQLPAYGVNAIALAPYGYSTSHPPRVHLNSGPESWENDEGLIEVSRLAHSLGMKVMLKPAIWKAFQLQFASATDRAEWFGEYAVFLEHYARLATEIHADIFCIGGEFVNLTSYDADWRQLIARVRACYPGPLVYAANFGKEFEALRFWDALDYIGLQEYYPLPDNLSTDSLLRQVIAVESEFGKPVIFTEAGFPSSAFPNRKPWDDPEGQRLDLKAQANCYRAIFRAFYKQPWFEGVYWWRVGTDGEGGPEDASLTPWGKPAMEVVKRWYLGGGR